MDENKNSNRKVRRRLVGSVVFLVLILSLFSFIVRRSEYVIVDTVSDFYISFLDSKEISNDIVTDQFRDVFTLTNREGLVLCGSLLPTEVRVGRGAAFWNDGSVLVTLVEATTTREAFVTLKKMRGEWRIDTIACLK